ncbi:MAG: RNase III inhibitor [Ruminococcaceae bacterium]|nr:RNase III inhibitor [Oscillospiraceae bacterium]
MPFMVVRNDITKMSVDAIVNTANPRPVVGFGVDSAIHEKAGSGLLEARREIGDMEMGTAAITPAFDLPAKYVIHTVGPVWLGGSYGEENLLLSCYVNALELAVQHGCGSVACPLISTGTYGFPKDLALQIAIHAFSKFLMEHEMQIYLVVFDHTSYKLSEKLFQSVVSYIDEHYVHQYERAAYEMAAPGRIRQRRDMDLREASRTSSSTRASVPAGDLESFLRRQDAGFTETLLRLIDETGKKDSEIYKKANISKQHFSKIRNNPEYKPTKATAIAFAIALELDVKQTEDLIGRAGYALTNSSIFDLIIRYFIECGNYNVVEINIALYEFDQTLLGA